MNDIRAYSDEKLTNKNSPSVRMMIKSFEKKAKNLNKNLRGDQAVYYINKKSYNG